MKKFFESIKKSFLKSKEDFKDVSILLSLFILAGLVVIIGLSLVLTLLTWINADSSFSFIAVFKESFGNAILILLFAFIYYLFHSGYLTLWWPVLLTPAAIISGEGGELAAILIVVGCVYWLVSMFTND